MCPMHLPWPPEVLLSLQASSPVGFLVFVQQAEKGTWELGQLDTPAPAQAQPTLPSCSELNSQALCPHRRLGLQVHSRDSVPREVLGQARGLAAVGLGGISWDQSSVLLPQCLWRGWVAWREPASGFWEHLPRQLSAGGLEPLQEDPAQEVRGTFRSSVGHAQLCCLHVTDSIVRRCGKGCFRLPRLSSLDSGSCLYWSLSPLPRPWLLTHSVGRGKGASPFGCSLPLAKPKPSHLQQQIYC